VSSGAIADYDEDCNLYTRVMGGDVPRLKLSYSLFGDEGSFSIYDATMMAGHQSGASRPSDWPSDCTYFDLGFYWWDPGDPEDYYEARACFSKGTDVGGQDEVYLEVEYLGVSLSGVYDNESDSDGSNLDSVYFAEDESDSEHEVWYISDSVSVSGWGYSATLEIEDARIVLDLNN